jgi:hypothetical protein
MGLRDFLYGVVRKTKSLLLLGIKFRSPESHTTDWVVVMKTSGTENMIKYNVGSINKWLQVNTICASESQNYPRCNCPEKLPTDTDLKVNDQCWM